MQISKEKEFVVAITGASGSIYGKRLVEELLKIGHRVSLIVSDPGKLVIAHELGFVLDDSFYERTGRKLLARWLEAEKAIEKIAFYRDDDLMAPICSGSHLVEGMIIIPCSMATLGAVANGMSSSLIERTSDVMMKEGRQLLLVPRETPLNRIHVKNMLAVQEAGAELIPAMPAFYHKPETIDDMVNFVVGKVLDKLRIEHSLFKRWDGEER